MASNEEGMLNDDDKAFEQLNVIIKDIQGETVEFTVSYNDTISKLIEKYKKNGSINENSHISLNYKGKTLDPNKKFKDYNISDGDILNILIRLGGGGNNR